MKKEPILRFNTLSEAYACLDYWQHRLYLDNWIISIEFVRADEKPLDGKYYGCCDMVRLQKSVVIYLIHPDDHTDKFVDEFIIKVSHEQTLVHELLHLLDCFESTKRSVLHHQELEMLSRTLLCAKYGLNPEYFINFKR